jgi:hypothetical protein
MMVLNHNLSACNQVAALLLVVLNLGGSRMLAQNKQVTNQDLYWVRYYAQWQLNSKLVCHNEIEERRFFTANTHHHLIIHSRLHYKFSTLLQVAAGFTYSLQSPHDPYATSQLTIPELRPVQEMTYTYPLTKQLNLQQRLRIDERFIHKNNGKELEEGYVFNFRFRYRIQISYRLGNEETTKKLLLKLSDELMVNAGKNIVYNYFDQNRLYVGAEKELTKNFSLEAGYLYWYQQRASGYEFYNRNIVRLTFYHKLNLSNN